VRWCVGYRLASLLGVVVIVLLIVLLIVSLIFIGAHFGSLLFNHSYL
jgi:hypothetical protein